LPHRCGFKAMINLDQSKIVFIDAEIEFGGQKVKDIGAVTGDGRTFRSHSREAFSVFLIGSEAVAGHNILNHDLKYLEKEIAACGPQHLVDTLYLSPLLFPKKPYHNLVKDDKLVPDEPNNPLNDAQKARDLFFSEVGAFRALPRRLQKIYAGLLSDQTQFKGFFALVGQAAPAKDLNALIVTAFAGKICANAAVEKLIGQHPLELAYALSLIRVMNMTARCRCGC